MHRDMLKGFRSAKIASRFHGSQSATNVYEVQNKDNKSFKSTCQYLYENSVNRRLRRKYST